jgi:hypothetical protein
MHHKIPLKNMAKMPLEIGEKAKNYNLLLQIPPSKVVLEDSKSLVFIVFMLI